MNHIQAINRLERKLREAAELFASRHAGAPLTFEEVMALSRLEEAIAEADPTETYEDEYSHREACEVQAPGMGCEED